MDPNASRFKLLRGRDDWARVRAEGLALTEEPTSGAASEAHRAVALTLAPCQYRFPAVAGALSLAQRRGAAADRFGSWYWIDASARAIRVQSAGTDQTTLFWSLDAPPATAAPAAGAFHDAAPAPTAPGRLVSLAVTRTHYLIVGTRAPDGLLLFDLHGAGGPLPIAAPIDFAPFDMAATPDGGVWLLDREHARLWRFDRRLDLVPAPAPLPDGPGFGPADGDPGPRPRRVAPEQQALDLGDADFVALCALPDCAVLLLEQTAQRARLRSVRAGVLGPAVDLDAHVRPFLDATDPRRTSDAPLVGHDLAFVPAAPDADHLGHLYVSDLGGWQVYAFTVRWAGEALAVTLVPAHYPMRLFVGKALVAHDGRVWYDLEDRFVPLIEQRRACYRREGRFTHVFDGEQPALVWHRLMLDGHFPLTTALAVRLRAADTPGALPDAPFLPQPRPLRRRATELPFVRRDDPCDAATVELFLHGATGRYLEIEVTLTSDGRSTPRLRSLRAWYPRFSYLDEYLPAVYREDPDSARFLTGFLGNLEGFYTAIEHRIETVQALFNPDAAPTEALDWLAAWLGVALDPAWEEGRRRLFIRHAVDFYRWRGTAHGLSMALQLAFGQCVRDALFAPPGVAKLDRGIRIIEQFRTRNAPAVGAGAGAARPSDRWHPADGAADLHARYRTFHDPPAGTAVQYPLSPADAARPLWSAFSRAVLGFEPQAQGTAAHRALWGAFLRRRYRKTSALPAGYSAAATFDDVPLPNSLPTAPGPLADWHAFESLVLPMHATAHRFVVALPTPIDLRDDALEAQRRVALAERIVALARPAHTVFTVKAYWDLLRLDHVRLGLDTLLGVGARAPELCPPLVLGRGLLGGGWLPPRSPARAAERQILGQRLGSTAYTSQEPAS